MTAAILGVFWILVGFGMYLEADKMPFWTRLTLLLFWPMFVGHLIWSNSR